MQNKYKELSIIKLEDNKWYVINNKYKLLERYIEIDIDRAIEIVKLGASLSLHKSLRKLKLDDLSILYLLNNSECEDTENMYGVYFTKNEMGTLYRTKMCNKYNIWFIYYNKILERIFTKIDYSEVRRLYDGIELSLYMNIIPSNLDKMYASKDRINVYTDNIVLNAIKLLNKGIITLHIDDYNDKQHKASIRYIRYNSEKIKNAIDHVNQELEYIANTYNYKE